MHIKGSRFTLGLWGLKCVRSTLRRRSQPSGTVGNRPNTVPVWSAAKVMDRNVAQPCFGWQAPALCDITTCFKRYQKSSQHISKSCKAFRRWLPFFRGSTLEAFIVNLRGRCSTWWFLICCHSHCQGCERSWRANHLAGVGHRESLLCTLHLTLQTLHFYTRHFTLHTLPFTLYTADFTFDTWHSKLHTLHSILYTLHSTLYTLTLYSILRILLFTLHNFALYTWHFTLYTPHTTLCTSDSRLYTLHSTVYTIHFTSYTLLSTLSTLCTLDFTLHTWRLTLHTLPSTL